MQRVELTKATVQGWARLDPEQRDKFFEAFVSAALRLDRLQSGNGLGSGSEAIRSSRSI
jgi:hypothetical protein